MPRILIQGWRFVPHSYAMVNQFQCLEMLRRPDLVLYHQDVPFHGPHWKAIDGLFDPASEERLRQIPSPTADQPADVTYRIAVPFNLENSNSPRTVVFGTAECAAVLPEYIAGGKTLAKALAKSDAVLVTPSKWSRQGFINSGAEPARVHVVPHGVDPAIFHPASAEQRATFRAKLKCGNRFAFLNVGAMTANKNIAMLLRALAAVAERNPNVCLVLKGLSALYPSAKLVQDAVKSLSQAQLALVQPRLLFSGGVMSVRAIAELYQAADAYVSPYSAEGFNLPVLEAAACGLPVICTAGGATDDFTTDQFARPIEARVVPISSGNGKVLAVDFDSLVRQMRQIVDDMAFCASARISGPRLVAGRYSWRSVVDQLLKVLLPDRKG